MHKLSQIEGLRGYLALCVLISHSAYAAGYSQGFLPEFASVAVSCFIIVSGFVIALLLDTKKEPYGAYIIRRSFRIFPVYLLLFLLAIPCAFLREATFLGGAARGWYNQEQVDHAILAFAAMRDHLPQHVMAHLVMLHGLIPESILPGSSTAFLPPAWSLSLEWQFYLVAPFWFTWARSATVWKRVVVFVLTVLAIILGNRYSHVVAMGAALPFQIEYFFCGFVCYLLFHCLSDIKHQPDAIFPSVFVVGLAMLKVAHRDLKLFPYVIWALVFALILEPASSFSARCISPILTNKFSAWLGKISYSIYLSHILIIGAVQWALFRAFPDLSQIQHCIILSFGTLGLTVVCSAALYRWVEKPFIQKGARLADAQLSGHGRSTFVHEAK